MSRCAPHIDTSVDMQRNTLRRTKSHAIAKGHVRSRRRSITQSVWTAATTAYTGECSGNECEMGHCTEHSGNSVIQKDGRCMVMVSSHPLFQFLTWELSSKASHRCKTFPRHFKLDHKTDNQWTGIQLGGKLVFRFS